jgi:hypothetical protein
LGAPKVREAEGKTDKSCADQTELDAWDGHGPKKTELRRPEAEGSLIKARVRIGQGHEEDDKSGGKGEDDLRHDNAHGPVEADIHGKGGDLFHQTGGHDSLVAEEINQGKAEEHGGSIKGKKRHHAKKSFAGHARPRKGIGIGKGEEHGNDRGGYGDEKAAIKRSGQVFIGKVPDEVCQPDPALHLRAAPVRRNGPAVHPIAFFLQGDANRRNPLHFLLKEDRLEGNGQNLARLDFHLHPGPPPFAPGHFRGFAVDVESLVFE